MVGNAKMSIDCHGGILYMVDTICINIGVDYVSPI